MARGGGHPKLFRPWTESTAFFFLADDETQEAWGPTCSLEDLIIHPRRLNVQPLASWVSASQRERGSAPRVISLDCEMVGTTQGAELAKITLVDAATSEVLLDTFVRPEGEVVDLRTATSGVTAKDLKNAAYSFRELQTMLLSQYIFRDTVLLGHGLKNDLDVLRLSHPRLIDTGRIFDHPVGIPGTTPSLRFLAQRYLKKTIQNSLQRGHSSIEDAVTCAELYRLKMQRGVSYGSRGMSSALAWMAHHNVRVSVVDTPATLDVLRRESVARQHLITLTSAEGPQDMFFQSQQAVLRGTRDKDSSTFTWCRVATLRDAQRLEEELRPGGIVMVLGLEGSIDLRVVK